MFDTSGAWPNNAGSLSRLCKAEADATPTARETLSQTPWNVGWLCRSTCNGRCLRYVCRGVMKPSQQNLE